MSACVLLKHVNKIRLQYKGKPKYLGESVTGMEIRLRKRWRGLDEVIVIRVPGWMPVDVQVNSSISYAHVQWFSCWKIRADDCDVIS